MQADDTISKDARPLPNAALRAMRLLCTTNGCVALHQAVRLGLFTFQLRD